MVMYVNSNSYAAVPDVSVSATSTPDHSAQYWESYYTQANTSLEKLIEVRWRWDQYLTTEEQAVDSGSCVPPYWVSPPTRPPSSWKKYLIWLTSEKQDKNNFKSNN